MSRSGMVTRTLVWTACSTLILLQLSSCANSPAPSGNTDGQGATGTDQGTTGTDTGFFTANGETSSGVIVTGVLLWRCTAACVPASQDNTTCQDHIAAATRQDAEDVMRKQFAIGCIEFPGSQLQVSCEQTDKLCGE